MTLYSEGKHTGEFIGEMAMSIGWHTETVTLLTGTNYQAGEVLGKVTASGKYTTYDNTASNGTETAARILLENVDASGGDKTAVVIRRGPMTVNKNDLGWGANDATGISAGRTDLDALGIYAR